MQFMVKEEPMNSFKSVFQQISSRATAFLWKNLIVDFPAKCLPRKGMKIVFDSRFDKNQKPPKKTSKRLIVLERIQPVIELINA